MGWLSLPTEGSERLVQPPLRQTWQHHHEGWAQQRGGEGERCVSGEGPVAKARRLLTLPSSIPVSVSSGTVAGLLLTALSFPSPTGHSLGRLVC